MCHSSEAQFQLRDQKLQDERKSMWRLKGRGCWSGVSGHFVCFLSAHRSQVCRGGADLRRSRKGKLCLRMPSIWQETQKCRETFTTGLFSADKNANFPFLTYQFRGDKPSVWQVLIYQSDTTGLWGQSQTSNHWLLKGRAPWRTQVKQSAVIEGWRVGSGMFLP